MAGVFHTEITLEMGHPMCAPLISMVHPWPYAFRSCLRGILGYQALGKISYIPVVSSLTNADDQLEIGVDTRSRTARAIECSKHHNPPIRTDKALRGSMMRRKCRVVKDETAVIRHG